MPYFAHSCKTFHAIVLALLTCLVAPAVLAQQSDNLSAEIQQAEESLYEAIFDRCDADALEPMLAPELEFYHDKGGLVAKSAAEFVRAIRTSCENQKLGREVRTRREAVPGTLQVHQMGNFGALAVGIHRFYHLPPDAEAVPTEHARYANLWRKEGNRWVLTKVFSYEHVDSSSPLRPK